MKRNIKNFFSIPILICISFLVGFSACQKYQSIRIDLTLNDKEPYTFGWAIDFDSTVILPSSGEEIKAGLASSGVLIAYREKADLDSCLECWIDKNRDGNLGDELPLTIKMDELSDKILIRNRDLKSGKFLPYVIDCHGNQSHPSIFLKPHYTFDGLSYLEKDTIKFRLYDTNADGIFSTADARRGFNLFVERTANDAGLYASDEIFSLSDRNYLIDSLAPDGSFLLFKPTALQPIQIGEKVPSFNIQLLDGKNLTHKSIRGKWIMLDFFGNTRSNRFKKLIAEQIEFNDRNHDTIRFISISCDHSSRRKENIEGLTALGQTWEQAFINVDSSTIWKVFGSLKGHHLNFPLRVLINPSGLVVAAGREMNKTFVGQIAPDFMENNPAGNPISLSNLRGKYVLLDFWASWCRPCKAELPYLRQSYINYESQGLQILTVSLDSDRESWINGIKSDSMSWPQVSDLKGWDSQIANRYGVISIPANVLINPNGVIIQKNLKGKEILEVLMKTFGK